MYKILDLPDIESIRDAMHDLFTGQDWERNIRKLTIGESELKHIFKLAGALWVHDGNMSRPHALLTSGKHSNGFVDTLRVLKYTPICRLLAYLLSEKIYQNYEGNVDWVVGSDHAGAAISHSVAQEFGAQYDFCEKGPEKTQVWKRFEIGPDEIVLQVEELITTTGTLDAVRRGVVDFHKDYPINFATVVATVVNRSGLSAYADSPIISLLDLQIENWEAGHCPLCAQHSVAIRPKENWALLTE